MDIETLVIEDIRSRQQVGIAKYGTTLADNPLPLKDWLEHAYQECLDQALYLKRAMEELEQKTMIEIIEVWQGDSYDYHVSLKRPDGSVVTVLIPIEYVDTFANRVVSNSNKKFGLNLVTDDHYS